MKSYSDITLKYLKKNKKRTLFTVIGIIMSLSLISGIGFLGLSFKDFMYNRAITYNGDYEFFARNLTKEQALLLKNDVDLEKIAIDSNEYNNFIYNQNDKEASGTVIQGDKEYFNVFYKNLEEGRAPESSNEIILGLSEKEDFNIKLGEKFEVDETYYDQDYNVVLTGNKKEYTVVGFYTETAGADGDNYIIGVTLLDTLDSEINYNVAFTVIDKENKIQIAYDKISKMLGRDLEFEDMSYNNDLLALRGQSSYSGINTVIIGIFIFVLAVIIFATIFLIYNAINISVTERMSQFGILRSIGASPKQVRNLVLKEGLLMCLMAIPFGVLCGYLGIWVTVKILGVKIGEMFSAGAFTVSFKLIVIIFTAIIGSLTILIASFGPAKKAGKINPIDIIKGNNDNEKVKNHVIGSSIIRKIFGVEGWIAYKNIRKNSKRFMVTILSLSISLIMFITFTTLNMKRIDELNYLNEATLNQGTVYIYEKDQIDVIEEKVKAITGVNNLYGWFENSIPLELDSSVFTEEFKGIYGDTHANYTGQRVSIEYFNDEILKNIGIEDGLKDNEIVLMNTITNYNSDGKLISTSATNLKEGDTLKIPKTCIDYLKYDGEKNEDINKLIKEAIDKDISENNYYEFKVKKIIDKNPLRYGYRVDFEIAFSGDFLNSLNLTNFIGSYHLGFRYKDINDIEEIKRISDEITALGDKYDVGFMDNSEDNRSEEELWGVVNVFVYGFIVMISLIGIVNVINTISLNILLKKKEFGTLGTIGMDKKQLYKMVILEGLLHGIIACIIGGIIAVGLSMVAVRIISYGFTFGYKLYWQPFAIGFLINIVVTIIASIIPLNKLKKMSLVETVRNIE